MTLPKKEDYIFYQGEKFQIEFYFTKTGKIPAKEYLEKESLDVQVKLSALVKYIADHGRLFDITKFRKVDSRDKISKRDLEKARNMKKTYTARLKGGIYYEKN
jgi:hypothetical protein